MLILTRRANESIKIGDDVTVSVLAIHGNQVRLGINAPKSIPVHREEIYQRIQAEKQQALTQHSENDESVESSYSRVRYLG